MAKSVKINVAKLVAKLKSQNLNGLQVYCLLKASGLSQSGIVEVLKCYL